MISLIIGAVVNIILDPIMIFGLLGCPGIRGAAIATVIGQLIGAAAALGFNWVKNPVSYVRLKGYRFLWQDVADIYRVGLPTIMMQAIGSVMTFAVNSILLGVSSTAVFLLFPRQLVVLVPCLWLLIRFFGVNCAWFAFWASEIIACAYSLCAARKELKNKIGQQ